MDMQSPVKRHRIDTPATQIIASALRLKESDMTLSITKDDALRLKDSIRSHVHRYISSEDLSETDASRESPCNFQVCVSPHFFGTNKCIQDLIAKQERMDTMELYITALYSSIPLCVADLIMVPMYLLDYHMRRLFLERKQNAPDPKRYQALFVGKRKRKPFKGTYGDQIRYGYVLRSYLKLVDEKDEDGEDDEEKGADSTIEQLEAFKDLLQSSEEYLAAGLSYCGSGSIDSSHIRDQVWAFLEGEEKVLRDTGAQLFTQLFHQQRRTPLEKQVLQDTLFPPENDAVFQLAKPSALVRMGLKVLALADIEKRLNLPAGSPFRLTLAAPTLVKAGVNIVKCFMRLKVNLSESIEFKYRSLTATMGEGTPIRSIDLLAPGC